MKKFVLWGIGLFAVALVIIVCAGVRHGNTSFSDLIVDNITLEGSDFCMVAKQTSSGKSFRQFKYMIEGTALYIKIYSGLAVSSYNKDTLDITISSGELASVKYVYLTDGKCTEIIFPG